MNGSSGLSGLKSEIYRKQTTPIDLIKQYNVTCKQCNVVKNEVFEKTEYDQFIKKVISAQIVEYSYFVKKADYKTKIDEI